MDLTLRKKTSILTPLFCIVLLFLAIWCTKVLLEGWSTAVVYSVSSLQTAEQIIDQVNTERAQSTGRGGGRNKPSLKQAIEQAKGKLSRSEYRAARSNYKRLTEHVEKLARYQQDPLKYDHLGLLRNAASEQAKQRIIQSRVAHLEKEIQTFYNNIIKIIQ